MAAKIETQLHICISGFRQNEGEMHGIFRLSQDLIDKGFSCNGHSRVLLYEWNDNWVNAANHIWAIQKLRRNPVHVNIYAYSWGAGYGARTLAKQLQGRGVRINCMVLCDPVYRSRWLTARWYAMIPSSWWVAPRIKMPDNVEEIYWFRQTYSLPQGHRVVASEDTIMHLPVTLPFFHVHMDDAPEFHAKCLEEAEKLAAKVPVPETVNCLFKGKVK